MVCFHAPGSPYKFLTISGLAYFLLLTFCLQGMGEPKRGSFPLGERARRLLLPWAIWSLFYGLVHLARHKPFGPDVFHHPRFLLMGTELHLWFLPFAFFGGIVAFSLRRYLTRVPEAWGLVGLMLAAVGLAALPCLPPGRLDSPLVQWAYSAPLLPLGLAIGMAQRVPRGRLAWHYLAILGVTAAISWTLRDPSLILGTLALAASILPKTREFKGLRWLAGLSMGIYLLHPFVFLVIYKCVPHAPWYLFTLIGTLVSAVLSGMIATFPRLDTLLFGTAHRAKSPRRETTRTAAVHGASDALLGEPAR